MLLNKNAAQKIHDLFEKCFKKKIMIQIIIYEESFEVFHKIHVCDLKVGWGHLPSEAKASKPCINKFKN